MLGHISQTGPPDRQRNIIQKRKTAIRLAAVPRSMQIHTLSL